MEILLDKKNNILKIKGEIDLNNSKKLKEEVKKMNNNNIVMDFKEVSYLDSAGIGALISIHKDLQNKSGSLTIINIDKKIKELFEMVGLSKLMNIS
ncbi:STAS domain-containing protein [Geotoga petraea]|jgi:anti-anti-sigma factor|uniref:Anti-sigma factor antagonist n=1 Tax=Geotoga petraea TaxID=28234 RepID=A0A1G6IFH1_9BACT|nr:STAS domain-containing protein [Geotoga petraea]TGG89190.1 anti-sigma factor antagonist [Geotoga petraea]SDC05143.1 anti-anti-sigma regulatory factor, SpoIIAA [Geotoga petraea]